METLAFADFDKDPQVRKSALPGANKLQKLLQLELQYLLHQQRLLIAEEHRLDTELERNRKFIESEDTATCSTERKPRDSDWVHEGEECVKASEHQEDDSSDESEADCSPMD